MPTQTPTSVRGELRDVILVTLVLRALALGAAVLWLWPTIQVRQAVVDTALWSETLRNVQAGLVPYVHFTREYPVGAGLLYALMSLVVPPDPGKAMILAHGAVMTAFDLVSVVTLHGILRRVAPDRAAVLALFFGANLTALTLAPVRFESAVVTLALLGLRSHLDGRPLRAAAWWALGSSIKWFPVVLLGIQEYRAFFVEKKRTQWMGSAAAFAAVSLAINGPLALLDRLAHGHFDHWSYPYFYHVARPLYWDTVLGVGQLWLGALPAERWASLWSVGLMGAAFLAWPSLSFERKGVLVFLAAFFLNRIYSPQFHLWFYPLALLAMAGETGAPLRRSLALWGLYDLLNVLVYPVALPPAFEERVFAPGEGPLAGPWTVLMSAAVLVRAGIMLLLARHVVRQGRMR